MHDNYSFFGFFGFFYKFLYSMDFFGLIKNIQQAIITNATNAKNGIVIKPNQFIYWELHGTPLTHGLNPPKPGIFCSN